MFGANQKNTKIYQTMLPSETSIFGYKIGMIYNARPMSIVIMIQERFGTLQ